jgi:hypothetical protein
MGRFFEVIVAIKTDNNGKVKVVKENFLVDAMSVTEAEARLVKDFLKDGFSQDFNVVGVKESNIVAVIEVEEEKSK